MPASLAAPFQKRTDMKTSEDSRSETEVLETLDKSKLPQHIAIIMDGNGRWARKRKLPRVFGHRAGINSVREIVRTCASLGVRALTLYAFSSENWSRPGTEVRALMRILEEFLERERGELRKNRVRLRAIGRIEGLPEGAQNKLREVIKETSTNAGLTLVLALNYGGRQEIVDACRRLVAAKEEIDEAAISRHCYAPDLPDPDLLIRTSGEMRLSNFLLWQMAYTELYITQTPWPEFRRKHLYLAVEEYQRRERRFGGL